VKKVLGVVLTVLFVVGISMPSFAAKTAEKKFERIVAQVVSVDQAAKTMVVTREENGEQRTISISAKAASKVQAGDRVRIKLKAGTNESAGVLVLGTKPAAEATADTATTPEAKPEGK
jgi:ribosomal protein S17